MDFQALQRDPKAVLSSLKKLPDGRVITTKPCKIYIPQRYAEYGLAKIGTDKHILGIFALVMEDMYYSVSIVNAMVPIDPVQMNRIKIDGAEYLEFVFNKGSTVMKTTSLVKNDTLTYLIFDEFFQKGKIPAFIGYEELGKIFDTAKKHADANVGTQRELMQLIASLVARDGSDRTKYYRTVVKTREEIKNIPPTFIPLMSVRYGATNTMNKLGGSYFSVGVNSALLSPSDRPERIETLLRK